MKVNCPIHGKTEGTMSFAGGAEFAFPPATFTCLECEKDEAVRQAIRHGKMIERIRNLPPPVSQVHTRGKR